MTISEKSRAKNLASFLGMSHGAANNRLRKSLLFKYVKLAGEDVCFRCNKQINSLEEFSIEHKLPWENKEASLFWDLDNIAFSHLTCNCGAAFKPGKMIPVDGESWCTNCKKFHPVDEFSKATDPKHSRNGLSEECKASHVKRTQQYRELLRGRLEPGPSAAP